MTSFFDQIDFLTHSVFLATLLLALPHLASTGRRCRGLRPRCQTFPVVRVEPSVGIFLPLKPPPWPADRLNIAGSELRFSFQTLFTYALLESSSAEISAARPRLDCDSAAA
ncbi:hypothetical protein CKO51_12805 [Rhodopirellula sp. SM50]|nr:hypothetical protein CKO51_12805 [Rhodopirellula sp. SM50]